METQFHIPVLVSEMLKYLPTNPDGIYVDGTLGGGLHAEAILLSISPQGKLIGFDRDRAALDYAQNRLKGFGERVRYLHENFSNLTPALTREEIDGIHGLFLDLGLSSHQLDAPNRGFSFQHDSRIDMRMDREQYLDGWKVVNIYDQERLTRIFWEFGEERRSKQIANMIVRRRQRQPINTTKDLASTIEMVVGKNFLQKSLSRIFQAIRIEVNSELENLRKALSDALDVLLPGGRIVVISYHSLEDRIVKEFFKRESRRWIPAENKLAPDVKQTPRLKILTKKPVMAGRTERSQNPRSRSAKLRAAERI